MTCREVMDDMQRELDGDLSDSEAEALTEHMRHCNDCADMYERLKRVSAELENLPKVMPPINLVDAILPELERIDRQLSVETNEPAAASAGFRDDAGAPLSGRTARSVGRRRWTDRFSFRALSGVVAAGIVVGLFLVTYEPNSGGVDDAAQEFAMNAANGGADRASMMDAAGSAELEAADQYGAALRSEAPEASGAAEEEAASSEEPAAEPADGGDAADNASDMPIADPSPASPPRTGNSGGAVEEAPAADPGMPDRSPADEGGAIVPSDGAEAGASDGAPGIVDPLEAVDQAEAGDVRSKDAPAEDGKIVMGIAAAPVVPTETSSPDGAYTAVLVESRVEIYDAEREKLYESETFAGVVTLIEWTPEGHALHFEVMLDDGTIERYRVDPALGTATEY